MSITRKHTGPTVSVETLLPEQAEEMLAANDENRPLKFRHVERLSAALRDGRWKPNGESIKISEDGRLLDGQHRLTACVKTGIPLTTVVARNVSKDAYATIDIGSKRTAADLLGKVYKVPSSGGVAASIRWLVALRRGAAISNTQLDPDQVAEEYERNQHIVNYVNKVSHFKICTPALAAALFFLFAEKDRNAADAFFYQLDTGEGLEAGDPVLILRNKLMSIRIMTQRKTTISKDEMAAMIIRAWNARRANRKMSILKGLVMNDAKKRVMPEIA